MWTCPKCDRKFEKNRQSHFCIKKDAGELFIDKPDALVLTFDKIMTQVLQWQPNEMAACKKSVVFTSKKAWLIVKPMSKELDVKFYYPDQVDSNLVKTYRKYANKWAHHVRLSYEEEVTPGVYELLRKGFEYSIT